MVHLLQLKVTGLTEARTVINEARKRRRVGRRDEAILLLCFGLCCVSLRRKAGSKGQRSVPQAQSPHTTQSDPSHFHFSIVR